MEEGASDAMNLDLNLGLSPESGTLAADALNSDHWVDDPIMRIREAVRLRARQRRRWRQLQVPHEQQTPFVDLDQLMGNSGNLGVLQSGEGSVAAEERTNEVPKACENNNGVVEDEVSEKKEDVEKGSGNDGSFFDCNICFDLASDPVVTCCGHLFCWPCLYQWLHVHSEANECPVCKGEVSSKNLVPIYGRGTNSHKTEDNSNSEVPVRPHARRVESLRQTIPRNALNVTVEEMIRRLGSRFDLRNLSAAHDANATRETLDRTSDFLNRIITSRGMRSEQNPVVPPDDMVDLTQSGTGSSLAQAAAAQNRRFHSMLLRRSQSHAHRSAAASLSAMLSSAQGRLAEVYTRSNSVRMSDEQAQPVDDRDSFSSIAAMINSESQMDTNMEIDSMVSLSTSSSRRRTTASRGSDIDSGDSHPPRRRRLN